MTLTEVLAGATVVCILAQLYHYVLYPALLGGLSALLARGRRPDGTPPELTVSLIICAYNEAGVIGEKLANCLALDPLPDEIVVVDDGSTDGTAEAARRCLGLSNRIRVVSNPVRGGKSAAMNFGAASASGEVLVFSDANEMYEPAALRWLLAEFADPSVGLVSGSHRLRPPVQSANGNLVGGSEGLYWRYEDFIRRKESALGATVASVGSMLAIRRDDFRPLPDGTVNDDAWLTMSTLARGRNTRFAWRAIGWEVANDSSKAEHVRRRRITAGRLMLLRRRDVWPLTRPAVLAAFLSHKVLRLALPILMIGGALANLGVVVLDPHRTAFVLLLAFQAAAAGLAVAGHLAERSGRRWRLAHLLYHVVQSNLVVLVAIGDLIAGRTFRTWEKPTR